MSRDFASFSLGSIIKKLNHIHFRINSQHNHLPKPQHFWLSEHAYQRRYMKIHSDGRIVGEFSGFVTSLIDFSFVRSIVAFRYSLIGFAYDPVSFFLTELPRILYRLVDPARIILGKQIRIKADCPSPRFTSHVPMPRVEVSTLCLQEANPDKPSILKQIFSLQEEVQRAGLDLAIKRRLITSIVLGGSIRTGSFFFRCPKLPADMDARIGVRHDPQNPNRKQKIFCFNAIVDTSIDLGLTLELSVACNTIAGNDEEIRYLIINKEQVLTSHGKTSKIDLDNAKYDEPTNYAFSCSQGTLPITDYNPRAKPSHKSP